MWLLWLLIAIAFSIAKIVYNKFFLIWFVVSALTSLITSLITSNIIIQLAFFIVTSFSLLLIYSKHFKRKVSNKDLTQVTIDVLIGQQGIVTEPIGQGTHELGQVKLDGETWSALTLEGSYIEKGSLVIVEEIRGLRLIVSKKEKGEVSL